MCYLYGILSGSAPPTLPICVTMRITEVLFDGNCRKSGGDTPEQHSMGTLALRAGMTLFLAGTECFTT